VWKNGLAATGQGRARRLPRETVLAIAERSTRGSGPSTANGYVRALCGFMRWLVREKRMPHNPLEDLALLNAKVDVRRARRELTADELRRLLAAARSSTWVFRGLTGLDRYFLYWAAATSGFRAGALGNLTPADFDLEDPRGAVVVLPARFNKSRKVKVQPLPSDVAADLKTYLAGKPLDEPVWPGSWAARRQGAVMMRKDLAAAGIPYTTDGPDGPEHADFHSLRHSYLTLGGRHGIDLRTLQELAGHSRSELTERYSHVRLVNLAGAVEKLPSLRPTGDDKPSPAIAEGA
jgi:integrase